MTALSATLLEHIRKSNGTVHLLLELTRPAQLGRVLPVVYQQGTWVHMIEVVDAQQELNGGTSET